ncbi:MAG: GNAT family N-acetyltransferase [Desulfobacterales bacterium]|nr:MAG: GNAT family N-acetyltransferase [Desulfobacterales bacterium]
MQSCEEWLELIRDLDEPVRSGKKSAGLHMRWARKDDLFAINALEGFVKETEFMEESLRKGDRCLLLEDDKGIRAFAWVTFRDFKLALWYTLKLPPGWSYLVYIFVHPAYSRQGVASHLLGSLMESLREMDCRRIVSGMYSNWEASIGLHKKMGFRIHRRLAQCKILNIFPTPPKEASQDAEITDSSQID